ncbi:GNAT family N-acetyltransferase [Streptomyces sp. NPDC002680]|uniref:GNAT family N-acetyltransferase n=1 Tax=Streptomyces sp. NPDC002680 TaxID=3364659 RepID=UPI0036BB1927
MDGTVRAWVDGWVVSRGASPPLVEPWGYTIDVGTAEHVTRHVLDAVNDAVEERTVRKVADAVTGTGVTLKVFADPATVGGWLGEGWRTDPEPGYLMSVPLTPAEAPVAPDGYRVRVWTRAGVTRVMLAAPDGSWAARGQIAPTGRTAVVDQVETSPAHRRRGLGSFAMRTLAREAVSQGAERGVLAGTPDGRALYEALEWRVEALLTNAKFTAPGTSTCRPTGRPGRGA